MKKILKLNRGKRPCSLVFIWYLLSLKTSKNGQILPEVNVRFFPEILAFIRRRQKSHRLRTSFQFPYGSLLTSLGNSVISPFPSFAFYVQMQFVLCLFFISKNVVFRAGGYSPSGSFLLPEKSSAALTASETFACASSNI